MSARVHYDRGNRQGFIVCGVGKKRWHSCTITSTRSRPSVTCLSCLRWLARADESRRLVGVHVCVIEVGHPMGTPAVWADAGHPENPAEDRRLAVCDRHRRQYDEDGVLGPFDWQQL